MYNKLKKKIIGYSVYLFFFIVYYIVFFLENKKKKIFNLLFRFCFIKLYLNTKTAYYVSISLYLIKKLMYFINKKKNEI